MRRTLSHLRRFGPVGLVLLLACAHYPAYPQSPQFDRETGRFTNTPATEKPSFGRVFRHILFGRTGQWPSRRIEPNRALRLRQPRRTDRVAVTFVNHSTVLIQVAGLNILTDPVWSERVGPFSWVGPERAVQPGVPFDQLPPIDVVAVSHNHYDHLDVPTLQRLSERDEPRVYVPLGDQAWLREAGIKRVTELDWWDEVPLDPQTRLVFTPARHNSGRGLSDADRSLWGSFLIQRGQGTIYFAGDTGYAEHFAEIRQRYGSVDLAFLPIGAYRPRDFTQAFHMDPAEAVQARRDLDATHAVAVHFGCFQLTAEDFHQPPDDLVAALRAAGDPVRRFRALPEGQTHRYPLRN